MRHFVNPYPDYNGTNVELKTEEIKRLIQEYVNKILNNKNWEGGKFKNKIIILYLNL